MNWSGVLRTELRQRATDWAREKDVPFYTSRGGTVLFPASEGCNGNFIEGTHDVIAADPQWNARLTKRHSQSRHLPEEYRAIARELDSSNSSDALLMNCFCYPGASERMARVLEASPIEARPEFGVPGQVRLLGGAGDTTELDMVLGDTIVEAKLTERDFVSRARNHVLRYADLREVFDLDFLPGDSERFEGFQLIRNVLAAAQHDRRLVVLIDARRPDLLREWWNVHGAIRSPGLRARCAVRFWQELTEAADPEHRQLLNMKYGFSRRVAPAG